MSNDDEYPKSKFTEEQIDAAAHSLKIGAWRKNG